MSGFPGVIGVIDGTSIPIRTPAHKIKSTYVNRHDIPALTLQGICDHRRRYIDIFTGPPGKIHDSRVFKLSFISSEIPFICGQEYHLLGDNGYPLRQHIITPYKDYGNLSPQQRTFNRKLSTTRVLIENSFGILKSRFRQLQILDFHKVKKMAMFIKACCVLHNLCINFNDEVEFEDETEETLEEPVGNDDQDVVLRQLGEIKRNQLCTLLTQ